MLWSLIKIVLFVVLVAAASTGAMYLMNMEGGVRIAFGGMEFTLTPLMTVIALVVLVIAVYVLIKLVSFLIAFLHFLNGDETAISRWFDRNRERKGYQALSDGMVALASGEGKLALEKAHKAEKYLEAPELTQVLTAQAAEMAGDRKKAEQVYKKLILHDKTKFIGVRGILKQKLEDGDTETAMKLAEKAFTLKPGHAETQDTLLKLQAGCQDWKGARKTLDAKLKYGTLPRDIHKRREAVLALSEARDVIADGSTIEAREAAIEANRLSPDLIPAAVMAAQSYIANAKPRYATRVLTKAWEARPHPDLAAAFAAINPDEDSKARLKRFQKLTKIHPEHRETKLLRAELLIAAEDFPEARRALGDLVESDGDARVYTIMAAIERGEGKPDAVVKGWLARALTAPRGPQWVCDNCQHIHGEWAPICDHCGAFDTLSWRSPPQGDTKLPAGTEMLPLIVGAIEDKAGEDAPDEAEIIDAEDVTPVEEPAETATAGDDSAPEGAATRK
ncbi:heme biosynthesis protein HemY [Rhodalgimonas zhirmunskyi]|uniref:Tetratricopeptide repeat protein n=1 Tax=Rhodalgimonas zhirmunskyi TaxID=2964767 RepID=A0AAJ1UE14_9RHOB|nr:heme biosynthesis HemY N-terminal domain-containing protein [Rhodoalgimonas zhirmunskyi]MDQ2094352.1 tetratricopeptide repeat protein [Rhodoalgimonas zhirmunskyi]